MAVEAASSRRKASRQADRTVIANVPTGTVTFLFTDIEGSTRMWENYPTQMEAALSRHDEILRAAIEARDGYVFKTIGDAFCAVFATAREALQATVDRCSSRA